MDDRAAADLLQYARRRVRRAAFVDLDDRITVGLHASNPTGQLADYLRFLEAELRLQSESYSRALLDRFRMLVTTESGELVSEVSLILSDADAIASGVSEVSLLDGIKVDHLVGELADVRGQILEAGRDAT